MVRIHGKPLLTWQLVYSGLGNHPILDLGTNPFADLFHLLQEIRE